jgi:putative phosphoribosyl transferase
MTQFQDRQEAGQRLAEALQKYRGKDAIVYALPRGGVVLGYEVAKALDLPLELAIARKIGHPTNPEYAVCAVIEDGTLFCNEAEQALLDPAWLKAEAAKEAAEARRRRALYGAGRRLSASGTTAIVVDDGVATGLTLRAALYALKKERPAKIVVATPAAPEDVVAVLRDEADEIIVLTAGEPYLGAVGAYYERFPQISDDEVIRLLKALK